MSKFYHKFANVLENVEKDLKELDKQTCSVIFNMNNGITVITDHNDIVDHCSSFITIAYKDERNGKITKRTIINVSEVSTFQFLYLD